MNLVALQHLIRSAHSLAEEVPLQVLGATSLLASTYDAYLCPDPFDELTAVMVDEALGENRAYFRIHGYHADILRDSILETLPTGWRERLVPAPETQAAHALDPHNLAATATHWSPGQEYQSAGLPCSRKLTDLSPSASDRDLALNRGEH